MYFQKSNSISVSPSSFVSTLIIWSFLLQALQVSVQLLYRLCEEERRQMWWRCIWSMTRFVVPSLPQINGCFHTNVPGESRLSHLSPSHTRVHARSHLDMNRRLTFRATLRSSFIQIEPPPPAFIELQQFFTDIISGCKWIWGTEGQQQCRHGQNTTLAGECFMTEMGILNTSPPEPSPNSIQRGKNYTFLFQTYWLRNTREKNLAIQMRCVYVCLAFEERRGVVSLKRRKGPLRCIPPSFFRSLPPFHSSPAPTDPHSSPLPPACTHTRTHIFTIARCLWRRHGG